MPVYTSNKNMKVRGLLCHHSTSDCSLNKLCLCGPASRASSPNTHKQQADVGALTVYQALNSLNNRSNDTELWQSNRESALFPNG